MVTDANRVPRVVGPNRGWRGLEPEFVRIRIDARTVLAIDTRVRVEEHVLVSAQVELEDAVGVGLDHAPPQEIFHGPTAQERGSV